MSSDQGKSLCSQDRGQWAEALAQAHLEQRGLKLLQRHYRVAHGPGRRGGEIDLIFQGPEDLVIFVEVKARATRRWGGASAALSLAQQNRIRWTALHYLRQWTVPPPCRFDLVAVEPEKIHWLQGAF